MESRRKDLLNRLEEAAQKRPHVPEDFLSISFQILYGLPVDLNLRAAMHMCERYLPIYEKKMPGFTWCRQLLGDIDAWFRTNVEVTPEFPYEEADSADKLYHAGFTDLLIAYHYRDDPVCLTASVCNTMLGVIHARAKNVFLADDPVVIKLEKEDRAWEDIWEDVDYDLRPPYPDHLNPLWKREYSLVNSVVFDAVYGREWLHVAEWLRAEAVWQYPDPDDLDAMKRGLKRWEAYHFTFLTPTCGDVPICSHEESTEAKDTTPPS